jgi:hypothetical protein
VKPEDVRPGRYTVRGDVVDVIAIDPGATLRSSRVRFILREKGRPAGALEVGEEGSLGIVNFAAWATPSPRLG